MGIYGSLGICMALVHWWASGRKGPPPADPDDNAGMIILTAAGIETWHAPYRCGVPCPGEFHAVGSGAGVALGALAHGATAEEALTTACEYDCYTSLPLQVAMLKKPRAKRVAAKK